MIVPFLLCVLVAASGLHFGARALALRRLPHLIVVCVLAHAAVSVFAAWLGTFLDSTPAGGLWLAVAGVSLAGFAAGMLWERRKTAPAAEPVPAEMTSAS
ncbi:hypothetical protein V3W47_12125 [Deinococcus sp. YIM 134068]|uniref:hypothetical protein n=1 Tax=Deinococcus lichenicola TaxID=3118910 RepID=UPI002F93F09A